MRVSALVTGVTPGQEAQTHCSALTNAMKAKTSHDVEKMPLYL